MENQQQADKKTSTFTWYNICPVYTENEMNV